MGTEIAYVDAIEDKRRSPYDSEESYVSASCKTDEERRIVREVAAFDAKFASVKDNSFEAIRAELEELESLSIKHKYKQEPAPQPAQPSLRKKAPSQRSTGQRPGVKPKSQQPPGVADKSAHLAKLKDITERRRLKAAFNKGIMKYYRGLKNSLLTSAPSRRAKESMRTKFKRFDNRMMQSGHAFGSAPFVSALKAEFPGIKWEMAVETFDDSTSEAPTPAVAPKSPDTGGASAVPQEAQTQAAAPMPTAATQPTQNPEIDTPTEAKQVDQKNTAPAAVATGVGTPALIKSYLQQPPSQIINTVKTTSGQADSAIQDDAQAALKGLTEVTVANNMPLGDRPAPPQEALKMPDVPAFKNEKASQPVEELLQKEKIQPVKAIEDTAEGEVSEWPALDTDLGSAPSLSLSGDTDPENLTAFESQGQAASLEAQRRANKLAAQPKGLEQIGVSGEAQSIQSNVGAPSLETLDINVDEVKITVPEVEAAFDKEAGASVGQQLAEQEAKLDAAKAQLDAGSTAAKQDFESKMSGEIEAVAQKQKEAQLIAQKQTEAHQASWQAENQKLIDDHQHQSEAARRSSDQQIHEQVQKTDAQVSSTLAKAQQKADEAVSKTHKEVETVSKETEKDKSLWDQATDYVASVYNNLKEAVNHIFDALIQAVNSIIEMAKTAVSAVIDLGKKLIVGFIKTFGEILKAAIKVLFAAFPRIAKKFETLIDAAISYAISAVQKLADLLKAAIQALLDFVATVIVAYIQAYQAIVNMVLSAIEAIAKVLKAALQGITHLVLSAQQSPSQFWGQLSEELLGQDVTRPLPNEIIPPAVETAPSTNELKDLIASSPVSANDASILHKTSYEAGDFSVEPSPSEVTLDGGLMRDLSLLGDGTHEFGHNDQDIQGLKADALQQDDTTAEVTETTSVDTQSASPDLVGPFHTPGERATFLIGQMKDGVMKWLGENKVAILAGLIAGITGVILANILTGGAIMAALPLIMQLMSAYFAAELVYQVAKRLGSYLSSAWPGNLVEGAKHLARAFVILAIELLMALLFGAKGAMKAAKGAAKTAKGGRKSAQQAVKAGAKQYIKNQQQAARKLAAVSQGGAQAAIKNGKFVMKGVKKSTLKGAKSIDDLTQKLMKQLRFKKFRFTLKQRRFKLEGQVNPWVLLASGKIEDRDIDGNVGDLVKKADGSIEGVIVGTRGSKGGPKGAKSAYVDDLQLDEAKAIDEFEALTDKNMTDISRGDKIRGGAKSERVSLRKEVRDEIYRKANTGRLDENGYSIYRDMKTRKDIPNYGTHYPDKTPLGHDHPKAGQPVPENLVGKPRADIGHAPGEAWKDRLAQHKRDGLSREKIIELENNPKWYVLEERSSNRSRKLD
ncbi:GH-E family nuclease [Reichenbachiella carrageenanivorans]|uniref:GH-E family nuclease n=1 Tax=Reichenbachiella carrageenanivorans TaxID=2979869 RepID=A0ABY6CV10_9BACT|nr:GH-E family nuclease [Reichenbachiella carrageenanivorans]UXX77746.1 GH-E family nuclease [Reichenbachiella carrageenanivorans]